MEGKLLTAIISIFNFNSRSPTLTSPCHSPTSAFPHLMVTKILGTFLIPLRWLCIVAAVTRFSGRRKQATASWRAVMTGIERDGRKSQVRRRERPSEDVVLLRIPGWWSHTPLRGAKRGYLTIHEAYQRGISLLWSCRSELRHDSRFQKSEASCIRWLVWIERYQCSDGQKSVCIYLHNLVTGA